MGSGWGNSGRSEGKPYESMGLSGSDRPISVTACMLSCGPSLCDSMDCSPPGCSVGWDFPGKNPGVGCHFFLQGIFPTQGLNLHLLHWQIVYQCTVWESLRNLYIYADTYNHAHTYEKGQLPTERCPPRTVMTAKWSWLGALLPHSACFHWWRWTPSASPRWPLTCCPPAISPPVIYLLTY